MQRFSSKGIFDALKNVNFRGSYRTPCVVVFYGGSYYTLFPKILPLPRKCGACCKPMRNDIELPFSPTPPHCSTVLLQNFCSFLYYRKDTEPFYHSFMFSLVSLLSGIIVKILHLYIMLSCTHL